MVNEQQIDNPREQSAKSEPATGSISTQFTAADWRAAHTSERAGSGSSAQRDFELVNHDGYAYSGDDADGAAGRSDAALEKASREAIANHFNLPAIKRGEGYFQALQRENPNMSDEDAVQESRRIRRLENGRTELKVGEQISTISKTWQDGIVKRDMEDLQAVGKGDPLKRRDNSLGALMTEVGYCTREQVDACLAEQNKLASQKPPVKTDVADLLVGKGFVSKDQVAETRRVQEYVMEQEKNRRSQGTEAPTAPGQPPTTPEVQAPVVTPQTQEQKAADALASVWTEELHRAIAGEDGYATRDEIINYAATHNLTEKERTVLNTVAGEVSEIEEGSNDEYGDENDGIRFSDITELVKKMRAA